MSNRQNTDPIAHWLEWVGGLPAARSAELENRWARVREGAGPSWHYMEDRRDKRRRVVNNMDAKAYLPSPLAGFVNKINEQVVSPGKKLPSPGKVLEYIDNKKRKGGGSIF